MGQVVIVVLFVVDEVSITCIEKSKKYDWENTSQILQNIYKELDEKIMLGMRLREGVNIYELINELNWDSKNSEIALKKLLKEWERFLESGLLVKRGNRFFLSDQRGMELSNQILISMFNWWEKIN